MIYFDQILLSYTFKHCLDAGIQNGSEASPSISPACLGQLVQIITLEPRGIFLSNFAYLYILTLSRHWYAIR